MKNEIYWIDGIPTGKLGIAPRPRGGDWLDDEVEDWRASGVDCVVSALTPAEETDLDLKHESASCRKHGIRFVSLPIPDRGTPGTLLLFQQTVSLITDEMKSGGSVLVHCRQGIGRAALIAASALAVDGETPDRAFSRIERARGRPVPDTLEQRDWVCRFSAGLRSGLSPRPLSRHRMVPKAHA